MKLERIFDELRLGALKNHALAREGAEIEEIDYPKIITCVNAGMTALYGRFKLSYKQVYIRLVEGKYTYLIDSAYSESNLESTEPVRWIVDNEESPFKDDLVRIHQVVTDQGDELQINDSNDCNSVMTPSFNRIQLPRHVADKIESVVLVYEASPVPIPAITTIAPEATVVEIPETMLEALSYYAAGKYMESSTAQDKMIKANDFFQKYEQSCDKLDMYGMVNHEHISNINVGEDGWP